MSDSFTESDLQGMVRLMGSALEEEDRRIRRSLENNPAYLPVKGLGITYLKSEHYYQFVSVPGLLSSFRYRAVPEPDKYDIALFGTAQEPVALVQMKPWMSAGEGRRELQGIRGDIDGLMKAKGAGIMVVFSANPIGDTDRNVDRLIRELGRTEDARAVYSFRTRIDTGGKGNICDGEFWVLGLLLSA